MDFLNTHVSEDSIRLVTDTLRSGKLSEGDRVREFESEFARVLGVRNSVALNSGTSAIHLGLVLSQVKRDDEVILPAQTFLATGMAVLMCGAIPVFADIDPKTGNLCPDALKQTARKCKRLVAIVPVHWSGQPCPMKEINKIAYQYDCNVVEDAAHALGATYIGRSIGQHSADFTAFSLQATKHLTAGDGGVLCCSHGWDAHQAVLRRWFGIDRKDPIGPLGERDFDVAYPSFKEHMNDVAASIGLGNLNGFYERLARRQQIAYHYRQELSGFPGLEMLRLEEDCTHAYYFFSLLVADRRDDFIMTLRSKGIPVTVHNRRIDRLTVFGGVREELKGQAEFEAKHAALPCHDGLSDADVQRVIDLIREGW